MVEIPATGQCFRRNSNFIKPRQTDKNSVSTDPLPTTGLPEIPQELQGLLDNHEHPEEVPKEFHPRGLDYKNDISYRHSHFRKGDVTIWVRMTLSAK